MSTVLLNGAPFSAADSLSSWGPLLEAVDRAVEPRGEIVALVRFDGVDEPGFREAAVLVRPLARDVVVEIETETPRQLVARVLDEGDASVPQLERATRELAAGFRGVDVDAAARGIVELSESLSSLLSLMAAVASAAGVQLDAIDAGGRQPAGPFLASLDGQLTELLDAHRERDWITVADLLEHELVPALGRLRVVLRGLRDVATATA